VNARAPQNRVLHAISGSAARSSASDLWFHPPRPTAIQTPVQQKPALCQRTSVSGRMIVRTLRIAETRVQLDKDQRSREQSRGRCLLRQKFYMRNRATMLAKTSSAGVGFWPREWGAAIDGLRLGTFWNA